MPIVLAVGIATGLLYVQTTQDATGTDPTAHLRADAVLTSSAGGLPPGLAGRVAQLPGVAAASEHVTSTGFVERPHDPTQDEEGWPLQGVTAEAAAATVAVPVLAGSLAELRGQAAALPASHAKALGLGVGDRVGLRLGDRALADLRVVALLDGAGGDPPILLPAGLLAAHTTAGRPAQLLVTAAPGVGPAELAADLERLAAPWPEVTVAGRDGLAAVEGGQRQTQAWVNYLLVGMLMAYTAISVVNTQVLATAGRRREFALQRLAGSTGGQVARMMTVEAALVAAIGIALGTVVSTTTLVPFSVAATGSPLPTGPPWIYLAVVAAAALLALAATLLPTWRALRVPPATAVTPD